MSASVASLPKVKDVRQIVEAEAVASMVGMDEKARLAVAVEALSAIAGENDLTCMRALFRMRRRAEEALARIRGVRDELH
uniref:Uncharacterized protein n=1 Tax=Desulfovibrio sp. U5L TaxID=596152 RepID=I2PXY3_9BACT